MTEVIKLNLQTAQVILTHLVDLLFVMSSKEYIKLSGDELNDFGFFKPDRYWSLNIIKINNVLKIIVILIEIICIIKLVTFPHLSHPSSSHFVHLVLIHVLIIAVEKSTRSSASAHILNLFLLIESLLNSHSLVIG